MADLHASLGEQSREEQPYLVIGHVVVTALQLGQDLGYRPLSVAQLQDGCAGTVQKGDCLRSEQHVPLPRLVIRQADVRRKAGTVSVAIDPHMPGRWHRAWS